MKNYVPGRLQSDASARNPAKIVIATFGTLGDIYPFLAVGAALSGRGHSVVIATADIHKPYVQSAGLGWALPRDNQGESPRQSR